MDMKWLVTYYSATSGDAEFQMIFESIDKVRESIEMTFADKPVEEHPRVDEDDPRLKTWEVPSTADIIEAKLIPYSFAPTKIG